MVWVVMAVVSRSETVSIAIFEVRLLLDLAVAVVVRLVEGEEFGSLVLSALTPASLTCHVAEIRAMALYRTSDERILTFGHQLA